MSEPMQLTIDGREVPHGMTVAQTDPPLSEAQKEILRWIAREGSIRSVDAGIIVHEARSVTWASGRERYLAHVRRYAASDGGDAMKRLQRRGLVRRVSRGEWVAL